MTFVADHNITEFAEWFVARRSKKGAEPSSSIAIYSPCLVCQPRVAQSLVKYLNEFDTRGDGCSWLFLNDQMVKKIGEQGVEPAELLQTHGNLVIESIEIETVSVSSDSLFKVHLSCKEPSREGHHLWLNARQIDPDTLTLMVASSYMEWTERDTKWESAHRTPNA